MLAIAACGSNQTGLSETSPAETGETSATVSGEVTVFAAASLRESFTVLGEQFEAAHPGTEVTFGFGPSSGLAQQITAGAPVDVFASASQNTMDQVVEENHALEPTTFAENVLEIAVPANNPGGIEALDDLTRPGVKVALCQEQVPCGTVAASVVEEAQIDVTPVSRETDVKAVLTKVQLGEVDAGLVYTTDVSAAGDRVRGIQIPADVNASTSYPIAVLTEAPNKTGAQAFVDHVLSPEGAKVITEAGFTAP